MDQLPALPPSPPDKREDAGTAAVQRGRAMAQQGAGSVTEWVQCVRGLLAEVDGMVSTMACVRC